MTAISFVKLVIAKETRTGWQRPNKAYLHYATEFKILKHPNYNSNLSTKCLVWLFVQQIFGSNLYFSTIPGFIYFQTEFIRRFGHMYNMMYETNFKSAGSPLARQKIVRTLDNQIWNWGSIYQIWYANIDPVFPVNYQK